MRKGLFVITLFLLATPVLRAQETESIFHDPFLNWDFRNFGAEANDFEIIVEAPNWTPNGHFDGYISTPGYAPRFPNFGTTTADYDGDGDPDTKVSWSGATVNPGDMIHVGLGMQNSGRIIDAYWTKDGQKIGPSIAIVYEKTRIRRQPTGGPGTVSMVLEFPTAFFDGQTGPIGLTNIQTFINLPDTRLNLPDINNTLDLAALAREFPNSPRTPTLATGLPIGPTDLLPLTPLGPSEVFLGETDSLGPRFESLLVADVVVNGQVIGRFWNINPQCPEPGSLLFLGLGALALIRRKRA